MFVNHPVTTSFSTLSLHDALPIYVAMFLRTNPLFEEPAIGFLDVLDLCGGTCVGRMPEAYQRGSNSDRLCDVRSEEHTSELQSLRHLVCRLLPEKKKQISVSRPTT